MKTAQNTVPELRFPEFGEDWKEKALGDFMTFKNGINADKSQYGHGRKFINVLDIIADKPIYHDQIIGFVSVPDKEFEKNEVKYGDILFQRSSETREDAGQSNIYLDKENTATFGGFVIRGRPTSEFNPMYFDLLLKTRAARKEITTKSGGSTRFNVGQNSLSSVKVVLTTDVIEQQKIASFLISVDDKLTKLRRKRELLNDYKRGLMQQLFSQTIRFKQDDGSEFEEWEFSRLDGLGKLKSGTGFPDREQGGYIGVPFYKVSDMNLSGNETEMTLFNNAVNNEQITRLKLKPIVEPSYIFAKVGAAIFLERKRKAKEFLIDNNMMAFTPSNKIDYEFCGVLLNKIKLSKFAQLGALPSYNASDIGIIKVQLPCLEEQQKIADCLSSFDAKIDAVAKQIQQLGTFKKGLLQKMFV